MIFLDTSAIYALADTRDPNHQEAIDLFRQVLAQGEELLVHNYVLLEAVALLQRRLGVASALAMLRNSEAFRVHWVNPEDHREAVAILEDRGLRGLSLVDCVSFVVMRYHDVVSALAFDSDFQREGFNRFSA
ncbi:MAG: PIN domain-containing protein [Chloroflexi bacterium]|nr:PIN domain-containing protein [Chloroflexota bacterium]